jgi:hypothetical protein
MFDDEFSICIDCFANDLIKKIIFKNNNKITTCDFCDSVNILGLNQDTIDEVKIFIECYLIYKYDEDDYNSRFGYRSIYQTFEDENEIFNWTRIKGKDKEAILLDTFFDVFESGIVQLSEHGAFIKAIRNSTNNSELIEIHRSQDFKSKFEKINIFIEDIEKLSCPDNSDKKYYRARIGSNGYKKDHYEIQPYIESEIGAPPSNLATAGRANREFISFLYLAEDITTAINEVRPLPGDEVSVGEFKPKKELNIFHLYNHDILGNADSYDSIMKLGKIASLNNYFSKPTGSNGKSMYVITQMFVEALAIKGYDGIAFESSFTKKINFTIFNPNDFEYIKNSSKVFNINSINVNFKDANEHW